MFNFDDIIDRKDSDSAKWNKYRGRDILPMWVADMDFASPPAVLEALHRRIDHAIFGYGTPPAGLKAAVIEHLAAAYDGWEVAPEWIVWLPGLVTGLNVTCRSAGRSGAGILTTVPVYPPFLSAPANAGKRLQTTQLVYRQGRWQFDWDDLRHSIDRTTAMFLLCSPHNPTGRSFSRRELETLAQICLQSNLVICSDEIHCDLILERTCKHIPLASIDPEIARRTITLMAPSKTYNIPGLGCAFAIIANARLRARFKRSMEGIVPHVNILGFAAAQAAYETGAPWLKALIDYLRSNRDLAHRRINQMPGLQMGPVEATYLAWIDARAMQCAEPAARFEKGGVGLSDGVAFGGNGFLRLNFGCPRRLLHAALDRMDAVTNHPPSGPAA